MHIKEFLSESHVFVDVRASSKVQLLTDLCRRAASILNIDADKISADILKREQLGSTGMGDGVAIPHARIAGVKRPFGLLARLTSSIDFDAIDRVPVDIVFLLLLPVMPAGQQLNALALVARKLRDADTTDKARQARSPSDLYAAVLQELK